MEIKKLHIENFTQFSNLTLELSSKFTVFIGNNGAGKTSILRALAILLSWFIARIEREKGSGSPILDSDIENDAKYSKISLDVSDFSDSRLFAAHPILINLRFFYFVKQKKLDHRV